MDWGEKGRKRMTKDLDWKLQRFAGGDGAGAGDNGDGNDPAVGGSGDGGNETLTFDDFLAREGNQAEFDRRIQKAVTTAVNNAREKWQALADDKLSEAEKLAKMTKDERAEYLREKERKAFEQEKEEFEREKLTVEVIKELQEQSLPIDFADALVYIDDAEKIKETIKSIKEVWDAAITEAIKSKARQKTPEESGQAAGGQVGKLDIREMATKARII